MGRVDDTTCHPPRPLTGTKIDLREDKESLSQLSELGLAPVKREHGQKLANKIRAVKYMECSALTQRGLKQVRTPAGNICSVTLRSRRRFAIHGGGRSRSAQLVAATERVKVCLSIVAVSDK